jgi:pimeloyl-ACP methyl ester carboxylesterase
MLLLHHGLGSVRAWKNQTPAFVAAGWQVVAYDRWGYGRSDPRPAFAVDFLQSDAEEACQLMDELGFDQADVVGHSDGGSLAILLAAARPERIARLVLVAAHIDREAATLDGLRQVAADIRSQPLRAILRREHGSKAETLAQAWVNRWLDPAMEGMSLASVLPQVQCPTLVIQGDRDEHATPQHARRIARGIPASELWLISGVGHMPTHEIPDEFNARVLAFLGRPSDRHPTGLVESSATGVPGR